jgi:hypothetical protein
MMGKSKIITYLAVAILVLAGLYWVYGLINKTPSPVNSGVAVSSAEVTMTPNNDPATQFVAILNDIDSVNLKNRSILNNKIFTALKDFGRTIQDRPLGRTNPFSPFAPGAGIVISRTASSSAPANSNLNTEAENLIDTETEGGMAPNE